MMGVSGSGSVRRQARLGVLLSATAVLFLCGAQYRIYRLREKEEQQDRRALESSWMLEQLQSDIKDAEVGERGFIITGDDAYLEPFDSAVVRIPQHIEGLRSLIGNESGVRRDFEALNRNILSELKLLEVRVGLRRSGGLQEVTGLIAKGEVKRLSDSIRRSVASTQQEILRPLESDPWSGGEPAIPGRSILLILAILTVLAATGNLILLEKEMGIRDRMDGRVRESESRFRSLFEDSKDPILITNSAGKIESGNPAASELLDLPGCGKSQGELASSLPNDAIWSQLREELASAGSLKDRPATLLCADDTERDFLVTASARSGWESEGGEFRWTLRDVTEETRATEALRTAEEQFRRIFENDPSVVALTDLAGVVKELNRAPGRLCKDDIIGGRWDARLSEGQKAQFWHAAEAAIVTGDAQSIELEIESAEETTSHWFVQISVLSRGRELSGFLIISTDVSTRKRAEEAERRLADRVFAGMEAGHLAWWEMELPSGQITVDSQMASTWGLSPGAPVQCGVFLDRVHPDDRGILTQGMVDHLRGLREKFDFECRVRDSSGEYGWFRAVGGVSANGIWKEGIRVVGVVEDISVRKGLEEQLRQAQRLEELGTLATGIAHDFNNLLVPIMGYADFLNAGVSPEDPLMGEMGTHLLDATHRARDLVRQILMFSRRSETRFQTLDLRNPVAQALRLIQASLPKLIRVNAEIQGQPLMVRADETQIQQMVMNLCTNAVHAMREHGGEVFLRLERLATPLATTHDLEVPQTQGVACLTVRDTGVGIPKERVSSIFDPFYTTKGPGEGTGLGLSLVRGIVVNHGGSIEVESEIGQGTLFRVFLPLAGKPDPEGVRGPIEAPRGLEHVMVVDDQDASRTTAGQVLERLGYRTTTMGDPLTALELFRTDPASFDLALIDYDMPGMTGTHLAIEMLVLRPDLPIVLTTGSDPSKIGDVDRLGVVGKIVKPFTTQELGAEIRRALQSTRSAVEIA